MIIAAVLLSGAAFLLGVRSLNRFFDDHSGSADRRVRSATDDQDSGEESGQVALVRSGSGETDLSQASAESPPLSLSEPGEYERKINRCLSLSIGSLGLATAGVLVCPPLQLLSGAVTIYTGYPVYQQAYLAIVKERRLRASLIDTLAIFGVVLAGYVIASAISTVIYYSGRKILLQTEDRSRRRLSEVFTPQQRTVWIARGESEIEIPFEQLQSGDIVVVGAGQVIPIDGEVHSGWASIDQQKLTGEAQPVERGPGQAVLAATLVLSGRLRILVRSSGPSTVAAQIGQLLDRTADYRTAMESSGEVLADRAVIPLLGISALAGVQQGISGIVTVLSCNYADNMRVAIPLSMLSTLNHAIARGVMIKDGRALECLRQVDTVVFDKTGTLTLEQPQVSEVFACNGYDEETILAITAAAEQRQSHPIARAVVAEAQRRGLQLPEVEKTSYRVGLGITAWVAGQHVLVGSDRFMAMHQLEPPFEIVAQQALASERGASLLHVSIDGQPAGALLLKPTIRPEVPQMLAALRKRGLSLCIISGDNEEPTRHLAEQLGIERYFAQVLPQDKAALLKNMQEAGHQVCFVGDGINDAIALKAANASVSLSGASMVATDTAQTVLMDGSLRQLPYVFELVDAFASNTQISLYLNAGSAVLCIGGVFVFGLGIFSALLMYNVALAASVANAMRPAMTESVDRWRQSWAPTSSISS